MPTGALEKSNFMAEMSMYISKASLDNGIMRWAAVNSDTSPDLYNERMSVELYKDFINNIKNNVPIPVAFKSDMCSDFWCGGMPYVSISHYPDLNGQAVPGEPSMVFVDGDKFKAKGVLFNNPLGNSVWRSLKEDKVKPPDEKIRISIGFLDLAHKHGDNGKLFVREGLYSLCPECLEGVGDKIYVKGYLVHLALTRVPVNERTEMVLEEKAMSKKRTTRKEDAASIVGAELAEEIELKQKATAQRSDALIEMSDAEPTEPIAEAEAVEEPETVEETAEVEVKSDVVVEKFEDDVMATVVNEPSKYVENLPYGGAVSMTDAVAYQEAKEEAWRIADAWSMFNTVVWNIFDRDDIPNKKEALTGAVDEFKNVLTAKAMLMFSAVAEKSDLVETHEHELQPAIDALLSSVDNSIVLESDAQRGEVVNPALRELANKIMEYIESRKALVEEKPVPTENQNADIVNEIKSLIQPLSEAIGVLKEEVTSLKSKATAQSVEPKVNIPRPRTMTAEAFKVQASNEPKPGSVDYIARKSVGL